MKNYIIAVTGTCLYYEESDFACEYPETDIYEFEIKSERESIILDLEKLNESFKKAATCLKEGTKRKPFTFSCWEV